MIEAKRETIMHAFAKREGAALTKKGKASYSNSDESDRAICTISKRYQTGAPYWYGYHPRWDEFLSKGKKSFLILGCTDRDTAYAIPHERISPVLKHLHKSAKRHWHIALEENESGKIELAIPKTSSRIGLSEFELAI